MADNGTSASGPTVAWDDIGGVAHQRVKVGHGADGSYTDTSAANPLPVATPSATVSGTITAANANIITGTATAGSSVTLTVPDNHASWTAIIGGTFSAGTTLVFQTSLDGTTWYYTNGRRNHSTVGVNETISLTSTDVVGGAAPNGGNPSLWRGTAGSSRYLRITASTFAGGDSVTVRLDSSAGVGGTYLLGSIPGGASTIGATALVDGFKTSYSAPLNSTVVASAVTTSVPIWEIQNPTANTTKLFRITRLEFQLTLATAGAVPQLMMVKRAVSTAGTAVAQTAVPHDSTSGATAAVVNLYTAAPTAGTLVGIVRQARVFAPATTLTATPSLMPYDFGLRPSQAVVLRPGQALSIQSNAAFGTAPTITGSVEWTEESI